MILTCALWPQRNELIFNGVYSPNNLSYKINDAEYVINIDEYAYIDTHSVALYLLNNVVTYLYSFSVGYNQHLNCINTKTVL